MNDIELAYHTSQVYQLISWFIGAYALGSYVSTFFLNYYGLMTLFSSLGSIWGIIMFLSAKSNKDKFNYAMIVSGLLGTSCGALVTVANIVDKTIFPISVATTLGVFVTMSFISQYVTDSQILMLGGFLSSVLTGLTIVGLISLFVQLPDALYDLRIITSFITFCGYIVYDTHKMRQKFKSGVIDYYEHAITLFSDIINTFVNVVILLIRTEKKKQQKKKN
jgi:FtsH-binding integral membrane protein